MKGHILRLHMTDGFDTDGFQFDIDLFENEELPCEILDHLLKFKLSRLLVWTIRTRDRKQQSNMGTEHNIGTKQFTENDKYKTID